MLFIKFIYGVEFIINFQVANFGILFNEAIIDSTVLAGLVRATAICASRAKRMTYQYYQQ